MKMFFENRVSAGDMPRSSPQYSIVNLQGEEVDMGVAHGDDMQYIFEDIWGDDLGMSPADTRFSKNIFMPLLTNFAKTSVPTPAMTEHINVAWPPRGVNSNKVLKIGSKLEVSDGHLSDRLKFWAETIPNLFTKKERKAKKEAVKDEL